MVLSASLLACGRGTSSNVAPTVNASSESGDVHAAPKLGPAPRTADADRSHSARPHRLSGGQLSSCLILPAGETRCWGPPMLGREALARARERAQPQPLPGHPQASQVAMGGKLCVLDAGHVQCATDAEKFVAVELPAPALHVVAGGMDACAILADERVACWGEAEAPHVVDGLDRIVDLSRGLAHACALRRDGHVLCWGQNESGLLGDGLTTPRTAPAPVAGLTDVVRISGRHLHTCALRRDGTIRCWGLGDSGQLGDGKARLSDEHAAIPVEVAGIRGATDVTTGNGHTCALVRGQALCWGENSVGQLGDGTKERRLSPALVSGLSDIVELSAGAGHTCALGTGRVLCWGNNSSGQTGQPNVGGTTPRPSQVQLN